MWPTHCTSAAFGHAVTLLIAEERRHTTRCARERCSRHTGRRETRWSSTSHNTKQVRRIDSAFTEGCVVASELDSDQIAPNPSTVFIFLQPWFDGSIDAATAIHLAGKLLVGHRVARVDWSTVGLDHLRL